MISTAVILCGGIGKRLKPYSLKTPKPMIKIKNKPFLYYILKQLEKNKFKKVFLLTGYKSNIIEKYFLENQKLFKLKIIVEPTPVSYETGLRLKKIEHKIKNKFLLMYGDNYVNFNFKNYLKFISKNNQKFFFIVKKASQSKEIGNVSLKNKKVEYFSERSRKLNYLDLGFFSLSPKIFAHIPKKNKSFSHMIKKLSELNLLGAYVTSGEYLSITNKNKLAITRKKIT